jgi:hypothetical protein
VRDVDNAPVEGDADEVTNDALELDQGEAEVVLVMAEDPIVAVVAVVLEENGVDEDLGRRQHKHEDEIVGVLEGDRCREGGGDQVGDHHQQNDELLVEEGLYGLRQPLLDLVAVLKE